MDRLKTTITFAAALAAGLLLTVPPKSATATDPETCTFTEEICKEIEDEMCFQENLPYSEEWTCYPLIITLLGIED